MKSIEELFKHIKQLDKKYQSEQICMDDKEKEDLEVFGMITGLGSSTITSMLT